MTKEIKLLRLKHTEKTETLIDHIRQSVDVEDVPRNTTIERIISDSLKRCFMTLFYEENKNGKWLRQHFSDGALLDSETFNAYSKAFECYVIVSEDDNAALNWNNSESIIELKVEFSDWWKDMRLSDHEFAALILTGLVTELFNNLFRYGDISKPVELTFCESGDIIFISMKNAKKVGAGSCGSKAGLRSKRDFFGGINEHFGFLGDPVEVTEGDIDFEVKVSIAKRLFEIKEG